MPWKIEIDRDKDDERVMATDNEDEVDDNNSSLGEEVAMDLVKTFLVPVRDPVTKEIRNVLVPVEEMDDTGLNVIKNVVIPLQEEDGSISYEIEKVVTPINTELNLPPRKMPEAKSLTNQIKDTQMNCKKEEEKVTEEKKEVSFDTSEEARGQEGEEKMDASKGEVDQILDICPFCQERFEDKDQMQDHIKKTQENLQMLQVWGIFQKILSEDTSENARGLASSVFHLSEAVQIGNGIQESSNPRTQRHKPDIHVRLLWEAIQIEGRLAFSHHLVSHEGHSDLQILRQGREKCRVSRIATRETRGGSF